ncbi:hypothetical protein [Microvirga flavescens]|uniref:hypothetical protein n=1 Tax=Microvirga flavescens TaxID=2249811 RepID=UPI000DD7AAF1|nr:hypothetical protein [Microvirga flavescens]
MRRRRPFAAFNLCVGLLSAALFVPFLPNESRAAPTEATFILPADDGYGIAECMSSDLACGHVVADSWCEAQGYAKAVSYREVLPEETTGSIRKVATARKPAPIAVTCTN